jgi:hypothetical protein
MDTIQMAGVQLNFDFDYSVFKSETTYTDPFYGSQLFWNMAPLFVNPAERDFSFTSNSSLSNKGISSTVFTDILGQARNNPPDIGAIELP